MMFKFKLEVQKIMKKILLLDLTVLVITFLLIAGVSANGESSLNQEYDLVGKRSI